jgi:hypothetical protein
MKQKTSISNLSNCALTLGRFAVGAIIGMWVGMLMWWGTHPLNELDLGKGQVHEYENAQLLSMCAGSFLGGLFCALWFREKSDPTPQQAAQPLRRKL